MNNLRAGEEPVCAMQSLTTWVRARKVTRLPGRQRGNNLIAAGELWLRARGGFCLISLLRLHAFVVDRRRVSALQPTYFLLPESRQRAGHYCPRPSGFACGQPAPSSSWGCTAKLTSRLRRSVQTRCRKSDDDAVALCGATASPKNLPSQAWAKGAIPGAG